MTNIELMNYWIESSDDDYKVMKKLYASADYSWCLFIGHLVIEKLVKAIYAKNIPDNPYAPKIHNIITLAKQCNLELDEEKTELFGTINTFNIGARYDDYTKEFQNKCTEEYTEKQINNIEEIRTWLKEQLI